MSPRIAFGAGDKEREGLVHHVKSCKVQISTIHDVYCAGFHDELVEDVDIVNLPIGNNNNAGNVPAQIQ